MDSLEALSGVLRSTVDNKVPDLAHEQVGGNPASLAIVVVVRAGIDQSKSIKAGRRLECGQASRVANKLGHVVEDDRLANEVCARGNVYDSGSVGR